ncbi:MAG: hypothetical protein HY303_14530 [Candidatus Wallbacteria bacterium]|nr:hypothetical protein [Candidatus Wallbacteria bacterium]
MRIQRLALGLWLAMGALTVAAAGGPLTLGQQGVERTVAVNPGLNLISIPLCTRTTDGRPLAASDLAAALDAGFVVRFDRQTDGALRATPYLPGTTGTDFSLEAATAYLTSAPRVEKVRFRGAAWGVERLTHTLPRGLVALSLPHGTPAGLTVRALVSELGLGFGIVGDVDPETGLGYLRVVTETGGADAPVAAGTGLIVSNPASRAVTLPFANTAPTAEAGGDRRLTANLDVTLTADTSLDADGDPLVYHWWRSGEAAPFATTTEPFLLLGSQTLGTQRFGLTVSDGWSESAPTSVTVTVTAPASGGRLEIEQLVPPSAGGTLAASGVSVTVSPGTLAASATVRLTESNALMDVTSGPGRSAGTPVSISLPAEAVATAGQTGSPLLELAFDVPPGIDPQTLFVMAEEDVVIDGEALLVRRLLGTRIAGGKVLATLAAAARSARVVGLRTFQGSAEWTLSTTLQAAGATADRARAVVLVHGTQLIGALDPGVAPAHIAETVDEALATRRDLWSALLGRPRSDGGDVPLRKAFAAAMDGLRVNYDFYEYTYPTARPIAQNGRELARNLRERLPSSTVILIGNSMGGLVCRYAAEQLGNQVESVISLVTPHHGSLLAQAVEFAQEGAGFERIRDLVESQPLPHFAKVSIVSRACGTLHTPGMRDLGWDGLVPTGPDLLGVLPGRVNSALAALNRRTGPDARGRLFAVFGGTSGPRLPDLGDEGGRLLTATLFPDLTDGDAFMPRASGLPVDLVGDRPPGVFFGRTVSGELDRAARFNVVGHGPLHDDPRVIAALDNFLSAQATGGGSFPRNHAPIARAPAPIDVQPQGFPAPVLLDTRESRDVEAGSAIPMYFWALGRSDTRAGAGFVVSNGLSPTATTPVAVFQANGPGTWETQLAVVDGDGALALAQTEITVRPPAGNPGVRLRAGSVDSSNSTTLAWTPSTAGFGGVRVYRDVRPILADDPTPGGANTLSAGLDLFFDSQTTSVFESALADGATWYFRVFDGLPFGGSRGASNEVAVRVPPLGTTPPDAVTGLVAVSAASSGLRFTWAPALPSARFDTYQLVSGADASVTLESGTLRWASARAEDAEAIVTGLPGGKRLFFRLFTVDVDGNSSGTPALAATVP